MSKSTEVARPPRVPGGVGMSEVAAEVSEYAMRMLLSSPLGRSWLLDRAARQDLEDRLLALWRRGLDRKVVWELYMAGDPSLVVAVERLTSEQIADLNAVAQEAWA